MKYKKLFILTIGLASVSLTQAVIKTNSEVVNPFEASGTVQRYLTNSHGEVNGFLLTDGTQVKFPPRMSPRLVNAVAPKDEVNIRGFRQNNQVINALAIKNIKTTQTITESVGFEKIYDQDISDERRLIALHSHKNSFLQSYKGLQKFTVNGKIKAHLFDQRGQVSGVILNDNSLIHLAPHLLENSRINTDVGQNFRASGYGTENEYGKSIEAQIISNKK